MLTSLEVHNFALIENLRVEFTPGFNVFTGETGAGKSILIDAFSIVLGSRASVDYLRQGAASYWIQAVFDIEQDSAVQDILKELDLEGDEDTLFLRRKVTAQGKSQAFVNEHQVPVYVLTRLARLLADIHGQHENQSLLAPGAALSLVDQFEPALAALLEQYGKSYEAYEQAAKELAYWQQKDNHQTEELTRLGDEIQEIRDAHIRVGEDEELRNQVKKLQHQENILQAMGEAYGYLDGGEGPGVLSGITNAMNALDQVLEYAPELGHYRDAMDNAWQTLEDVRQSLGEEKENDADQQEVLAQAQERLDMLYHLKQKYGGTLEKVLAYAERAQKEYDSLLTLDSTLRRQAKLVAELYGKVQQQADVLTRTRQTAGKRLCEALLPHIRDLAMPQGRVQLAFDKLAKCGPRGQDEAQFLFSANAGMDLKPLGKIASGGELSRFALALKTVMLRQLGVPTMIFDEIDTGVGGVTAQKMAEKMALIARQRQVLCITHLAQIACFADHHLYIHKVAEGGTTSTRIQVLEPEDRIREIMRMTGGTNASASARENAKELLSMAQQFKEKSKEMALE